MNAQKFTQKSLEAVQSAQNLAIENQNAQIEDMHLFLALLEQENSLIEELFGKINPNEKVKKDLKEKISKQPKITGSARPKDRYLCFTRCRLNTYICRNYCKRNER